MKPKNEPFNLDLDFIHPVKNTLAEADFSESGILNRLNCKESVRVSPKDIPRLLKLTAAGTPLDILIHLFVLGVNVDIADARQAVEPLSIDCWCRGGLLGIKGKMVSSALRIVPTQGFLLAFDHSPRFTNHEARPDHVHGAGQLSMDLLNATVRRKVKLALDMGTGCGIQGMLLSRHSKRVISTDINPRALNIATFNAALNGIGNIELREGSCFDPVLGEQFDLITMNPPFAISPDKKFYFRDGGTDGDGFVRELVQNAPKYLKEGGFFQLTAQWAHTRNADWQARLSEWFKGCGCDVWIICLKTQNAETYATNWILETEKTDPSSYIRIWEDWMAYYHQRGIESVSTGIINMRRSSGRTNWFWVHEDADQVDEFAGASIESGFRLKDFLSNTSHDALLNIPFQVAPEIRIQQLTRSKGDGWIFEKTELYHPKGIHYHGNLDGHMMELIGRCNGQRPLGELVEELATHLGIETAKVTNSVLQIIHALIERGFLLPPDFK